MSTVCYLKSKGTGRLSHIFVCISTDYISALKGGYTCTIDVLLPFGFYPIGKSRNKLIIEQKKYKKLLAKNRKD